MGKTRPMRPMRPMRAHLKPVVVLVLAGGVSYVAWGAFQRFEQRLPVSASSSARFTADAAGAALRSALNRTGSRGSDAWNARIASIAISEALRSVDAPRRLVPRIARAAAGRQHGDLGRLQLAVARLLTLERSAEPAASWWAQVRRDLAGLESGDFSHGLGMLLRAVGDAYARSSLGTGTAREIAYMLYASAHGPFLQYATGALEGLASECERAGDLDAAAVCRGISRRLLVQWVLEPGPSGLRLLAADLLAESLARRGTGDKAVVADLRAWRQAYLAAAARRPMMLMSVTGWVSLCPDEDARLAFRLLLSRGAIIAMLSAALASVLPCWATFWKGGLSDGIGRYGLAALLVVALVIGGGVAWVRLAPDSAAEAVRAALLDLRQATGDAAARPNDIRRTPIVLLAAGIAPLILALGASLLVQIRVEPRVRVLPRFSSTLMLVWLLLGLVSVGSVWLAEGARRSYESALDAALVDDYAAMTGDERGELLSGVRRLLP